MCIRDSRPRATPSIPASGLTQPASARRRQSGQREAKQSQGGRLGNQEAANLATREKRGVNVEIGFAGRQPGTERVAGTLEVAAVGRDESGVEGACERQVEGMIVLARRDTRREACLLYTSRCV